MPSSNRATSPAPARRRVTRGAGSGAPIRIAVLLESSRAFGRGVLDGLAECLRERPRWIVYYQECGLDNLLPKWFERWEGDGIIARVHDATMAAAILRKRVPVVDVLGVHPMPGVGVVKTDTDEVPRLAAEHLLQRGFKHFAYCGYANFSVQRGEAFARFVSQAGFDCVKFAPPERRLLRLSEEEDDGWAHQEPLIEWLRGLPKPVGIMTCNDARGHQLLNAARHLGLAVPDDLAVVGVDNYETICKLAVPPLSSVEQNVRGIASEAARMLERMLRGERPPAAPVLLKPYRVVTRRSTDALAVSDPNLKKAVSYIRAHATDGADIAQVAAAAGLSRRVLERRFVAAFGHSPGKEILSVQMQAVKSLLTETDWPLYRIAEKTGFSHTEYMHVAFKRHTGMTPRGYRVQMRERQ